MSYLGWRVATGISWVEARDIGNHPAMYRTVPVTQNDLAPKSTVPWLGNPALRELLSMVKRLNPCLISHGNRKISGHEIASPTTWPLGMLGEFLCTKPSKSANFKKGLRVRVYVEDHIKGDYCKPSIGHLVN